MTQRADKPVSSSKRAVSRVPRYPEAKTPLNREVHAPSRTLRFGFSACSSQKPSETDFDHSPKQDFTDDMGNLLSQNYENPRRNALNALRYSREDKEVIDVDVDDDDRCSTEDKEVIDVGDDEPGNEVIADNSRTEVEIIENGATEKELEEMMVKERNLLEVAARNNGYVRVDSAAKMLSSLSLNRPVVNVWSVEANRKSLESAKKRTSRLKESGFSIALNKRFEALLRNLVPWWRLPEKPEIPPEPFIPLSKEEEAEVERAYSANDREVLVSHKNSNIDITGQGIRCLRPGEWLNDEVINLYLELLKERQDREPQRFLKCHFFNTFFYKKLVSAGTRYSYGAVRRWTSVKKLGYHLMECDKIFIPIHRNIHWTLAVINVKDQKFQYLDSFKAKEPLILKAVARYFVEEVKDKNGKDIDVSSWEREFVKDLPEQKNGYDCGMFMLKYIDFYSRGLGLWFSQEQMPYFRVRTTKEILRLRAE